MRSVEVEQRVAILLSAFGDEMADAVLSQLSPDGEGRLRQQIQSIAEEPPDEEAVAEVVGEFDRVLRFALESIDDDLENTGRSPDDSNGPEEKSEEEEAVFVPSDDAVADLKKLHGYQIAGGLKGESARVMAIVLDCLDPPLASDTLRYLSDDERSHVLSQLNVLPPTPPVLLIRIVRTTIEKGLNVKREAVTAGETNKEKKLAEMLRNMEKKDRNQIIEKLEEDDADLVARIRELLYRFEDICDIEDRSLQKLLGEIETRTLCTALNGAGDDILNKVTSNLSKRARESLLEEMSLMGRLSDDDQQAAQKEVVEAIQRLDQAGDLVML